MQKGAGCNKLTDLHDSGGDLLESGAPETYCTFSDTIALSFQQI